jgi:hypothetical protein
LDRFSESTLPQQLILLTRYSTLGASSRQRMLLFRQRLQVSGYSVADQSFLTDGYLERLYGGGRMRWLELLSRYYKRIATILHAPPSAILWVEKEALPWLPAWLERALIGRRTLVVDFDDAWQLRYRSAWATRHLVGFKLEKLARRADAVTVANRALEAWAREAGCRRVFLVPTIVDMDHYAPLPEPALPFTIGWIGTPLNVKYLASILPVLQQMSAAGARLLVIGASDDDLALPGVTVEAVPWSYDTEARQLSRCHVGIMPLHDEGWEQHKSGFKLIQYMAAGRPVVASPVGSNNDIVVDGMTGLFARSHAEWLAALTKLHHDPDLRQRMGAAGRLRAEQLFSLDLAIAKVLEAIAAAQQNRAAPRASGSRSRPD